MHGMKAMRNPSFPPLAFDNANSMSQGPGKSGISPRKNWNQSELRVDLRVAAKLVAAHRSVTEQLPPSRASVEPPGPVLIDGRLPVPPVGTARAAEMMAVRSALMVLVLMVAVDETAVIAPEAEEMEALCWESVEAIDKRELVV